ncbi:MAG: hemerythrin domain-containing protein [Pseudonocardia sp.]
MTTQPIVTPRRPGEPEVDHTVLLLVHRAMLTDAARFAELLTDLAREGLPIPARRAVAIRDYLLAFGTELHEHHSREDDVAWPVIAASAGAAVDLAPLTEDHAILGELIASMTVSAHAFAADPAAHAQRLATGVCELCDLLHEHVPEEERDVLPVISQYVSVPDWTAAEDRMLAGMSVRHLAWMLPWIARFATPPELAHVLARGGAVFRLLLALTRGGYRRRDRLIFGPAPVRRGE